MHRYILYFLLIITLFYSICCLKRRNPKWIISLAILSFISTSLMYLFEATTVFTVVNLFGIQVHMDDIILIILIFFVIIHFIQKGLKISTIGSKMLLLIIPVFFSLFRGLLGGYLGTTVFMNDTRKFFYFAVAMVAAEYTFSDMYINSNFSSCKKYIDNFVNIVVIYVCLLWGLDLALGFNHLPGQQYGTLSDGGSTFRIIQPQHVLIIAFYCLWELYRNLKKYNDIRARTIFLCVIVIFMQWRTVIASFLIGVILICAMYLKNGNFMSKSLLIKVLSLLVICIAFSVVGSNQGITISNPLSNLFTSLQTNNFQSGTFGTRILVWTALLQSLTGFNALFGRPFGMYLQNSMSWEVAAHNGYVDYIMPMGYIGLALFLLFVIFLFKKMLQYRIPFLMVLLVCMLVYWFGYGFSVHQGMILGIIVAAIKKINYKEHNI